MLVLIGMCGCCKETVARSDNLAQASLPRLGKMRRDSPRPFHASGRSGDQLNFERECAEATVSMCRALT